MYLLLQSYIVWTLVVISRKIIPWYVPNLAMFINVYTSLTSSFNHSFPTQRYHVSSNPNRSVLAGMEAQLRSGLHYCEQMMQNAVQEFQNVDSQDLLDYDSFSLAFADDPMSVTNTLRLRLHCIMFYVTVIIVSIHCHSGTWFVYDINSRPFFSYSE